jgi:hypothetical protein
MDVSTFLTVFFDDPTIEKLTHLKKSDLIAVSKHLELDVKVSMR